MKIVIKPINKNDFKFLKDVYRSTREHELIMYEWTEEQKNQFVEFQFNAQHSHYQNTYNKAELNLILVNKTKAGRLYFLESVEEIRLIDISLLPKFRGKGVGTKILKDFIEKSNKKDKVLNLHVLQNNPALKLYKRMGFKITKTNSPHYFMERLPKCTP